MTWILVLDAFLTRVFWETMVDCDRLSSGGVSKAGLTRGEVARMVATARMGRLDRRIFMMGEFCAPLPTLRARSWTGCENNAFAF